MTATLQDFAPARPPKPARRGRKFAIWLLGFAAVSLVVTDLAGERGLLEYLRTRAEHQRLQQELARARERNARLREAVRRLREDPAAVEALARGELGMLRPGETLFILRDVEDAVRR